MWRIESHYPLRDIIILFYFIPLYTILFYFISSNILLNLFQSSNILFISRNFDLIFRYNFSFLFTRLIFFLEMIWNNFGILRSGILIKKNRPLIADPFPGRIFPDSSGFGTNHLFEKFGWKIGERALTGFSSSPPKFSKFQSSCVPQRKAQEKEKIIIWIPSLASSIDRQMHKSNVTD